MPSRSIVGLPSARPRAACIISTRPVSGGRAGAIAGKLAVMVGGDQAAFITVRPLIACFGENIFHLGEAGAGTLTKLINNQIFLAASVLVQEGFVMGAKAGMDPATVLDVLKVSSAASVVGRAGLFLSRKFDADLFALAIASKDIDVALASVQDLGVRHADDGGGIGRSSRGLGQRLGRRGFLRDVEGARSARWRQRASVGQAEDLGAQPVRDGCRPVNVRLQSDIRVAPGGIDLPIQCAIEIAPTHSSWAAHKPPPPYKPATPVGLAAVVGEMQHHFFDLLARYADVLGAHEMGLQFVFTAQHRQGGDGDHRTFGEFQARSAPDVTEQVADRDLHEITAQGGVVRRAAKQLLHGGLAFLDTARV